MVFSSFIPAERYGLVVVATISVVPPAAFFKVEDADSWIAGELMALATISSTFSSEFSTLEDEDSLIGSDLLVLATISISFFLTFEDVETGISCDPLEVEATLLRPSLFLSILDVRFSVELTLSLIGDFNDRE